MSAKRPAHVDGYLAGLPPAHRETLTSILGCLTTKFPQLELRLAWNVPHLCLGNDYVVGFSAAKGHVSFSPWSAKVLAAHRSQLGKLEATTHLIRIPPGWKLDQPLLISLVRSRLSELKSSDGPKQSRSKTVRNRKPE